MQLRPQQGIFFDTVKSVIYLILYTDGEPRDGLVDSIVKVEKFSGHSFGAWLGPF